MRAIDFDRFRETLTKDKQVILDQVWEEETKQWQKEFISHMERDVKHLEIVNFCANFFVPGQPIPEKTGYRLALIEPLYPLRIKNFDLGIFRKENSSLLLVECKSSVSDFNNLMNDLKKAIDVTNASKPELERILGNKIMHSIEFALCLPAVDANEAYNQTIKKSLPICVWAASQFDGKMRHFNNQPNAKTEINAGRLHRDGNLNGLFSRGVESKSRAIRPIAILPSSHMGTLIDYVCVKIYLSCKSNNLQFDFMYSDVYGILEKDLGHMTSLTSKDIEQLTEKVFDVTLRKGIFIDMTDQAVPELKRKIFQISGRKNRLEMMRENIKSLYVSYDAREKAKEFAVTKYREKTGAPDITSYFK